MKNQLPRLLRGTYPKNRFADVNILRGVALSFKNSRAHRPNQILPATQALPARRARRQDARITLINDTVLLSTRSKNARLRAVKSAYMPQAVEARELLAAFRAGAAAVFVREDVVEPSRIWQLVEGGKRKKRQGGLALLSCLSVQLARVNRTARPH